MKLSVLLPIGLFAATCTHSWGVYAPIPLQEQGKALSFTLSGGAYHDSNIFGAASGEVDSLMTEVVGNAKFNASMTDQTFLSLSYQIQQQFYEDRPSDRYLINHSFRGALDHTFSPTVFLTISDSVVKSENPQSIQATVLQSEQSSTQNTFDLNLRVEPSEKFSVTNKYRNTYYSYDDSTLATQLDRVEHLYGLETSFRMLPELSLVGEYRYRANVYSSNTVEKDNSSNFILVGADYAIEEQFSVNTRVGLEVRDREAADNNTEGYFEVTGVYTYGPRSYLSAAATYSISEATDTALFLDSETLDFVFNGEHFLTALISVSGSLTYQTAVLRGRTGVADVDEDTYRAGVALNYQPTDQWTVSALLDYDKVESELAAREQKRTRVGINARYSF